MKLKTKMRKIVENHLKSLDFYKIDFYNETFKPEGKIITNSLDIGYFKTELSNDESKIRISFQLLEISPIIISI